MDEIRSFIACAALLTLITASIEKSTFRTGTDHIAISEKFLIFFRIELFCDFFLNVTGLEQICEKLLDRLCVAWPGCARIMIKRKIKLCKKTLEYPMEKIH